MLLGPEMGGLVTKMAQIWAKTCLSRNHPRLEEAATIPTYYGQKPILWSNFVATPPISGLRNTYKSWFFDKYVQLFFYKVFTEIWSLGFRELGIDSKRTDISK